MIRWMLAPALLGVAAAATAVTASEASPPADSASEIVRRFVTAEVAREQPTLRAEITVGELDARLRLAPCARTEAYLHQGTRLWGQVFVGYRCMQRPGWSVSIPVNVRLYGSALVAVEPIAALHTVPSGAVRREQVEVTREPAGVVGDIAELEDRICTRSIEAGQPIPLSCLRMQPAVGQGDMVKLVGLGSGFTISTDGTALATAIAGETVRVRTESGRTVSGVARKGRVVEVNF